LSYSPVQMQLYCFLGLMSCVVDWTFIGLSDANVFLEDSDNQLPLPCFDISRFMAKAYEFIAVFRPLGRWFELGLIYLRRHRL